jgi:Ca2+-binding EF-hand superfamily protein
MSAEWAQQQVEKFKFDFDQADKDKSGSLSLGEVYDVLLRVGFKGTQEEAKVIFGHLDRDRDQKISREEFTAALKNLPRLSIKEFVLRKVFLKLDKDGSGYLSRSEIEDATKSEGGLNIAADKIADLLIYLVKDDDGKVSYEEFLNVLGVQSAATVMRQVFAKLDSDGSGFLSKEEILDGVKSESELKLKAEKISDLLIYWCRDQDKKISYEEFVDVWLKQKGEKPAK